jgi:hypothetical protein
MAVTDLQQRFKQKQSELISEWQSPQKAMQYSKPSPEYLNMRHRSQKMIRTKRFDEMGDITFLMGSRMESESAAAARRLEKGFAFAEANLRKWLEAEQQMLKSVFETKLDNITRERERSVKPSLHRSQTMLERGKELLKQLQNPVKPPLCTKPLFPACDNAALMNINGTPKLKLSTPVLKSKAMSRQSVDEKIANARKLAKQLKSKQLLSSAESGMDVSHGSVSLSDFGFEGSRRQSLTPSRDSGTESKV